MKLELPEAVEKVVDRVLWPVLQPYRRFVVVTCIALVALSGLAAYFVTCSFPINKFGPAVLVGVIFGFHFITRGSLDRLKELQQRNADKSAKHYVPKFKPKKP